LYPVYLPLEAFACDKPSVSLELARKNSWEKNAEEEPPGDTLLGLVALWA
jgi:hypothetical protein